MMYEELMLSLNVIASTNIKRKKPWSRIVWIGKEEEESLVLLDPKRISLLYLPQGKTKKNIPKVSSLVAESISINTSKNGMYLAGLLQGGAVFLWKKDENKLWLIQGLPQYIDDWETNQDSYSIFISDDATKILAVSGSGHVYVWLWAASEPDYAVKQLNADGCWYPVDVPDNISKVFRDCNEPPVISTMFYSNVVVGCCCNCSFLVHTKRELTIVTLYLNFLSAALSPTSSFYPFSPDWMSIRYNQNNALLSNLSGRPVAAYSNNGQILAVAVNKNNASHNKVLFLSPFTNTSVVSDMKGCGAHVTSHPMHHSYYWVVSMAWTYDNLFLACMLHSGSVCILPRLGEPVLLQTSGQSVDMGPACFLPLHPLIIVSSDQGMQMNQAETNGASDQVLNSQRFSISTHPRLPIIVCSDGFLVTVLELPPDLTCMSLVRDLVSWSSQQMSALNREYNLNLTFTTAYQSTLNGHVHRNSSNDFVSPKLRDPYRFEDPGASLYSEDSEQSIIQEENIAKNLEAGKIIFGVHSATDAEISPQSKTPKTNPEILRNTYLNLLLAWKLEVTSGCVWDSTKDKVVKQTLLNTTKLFTFLLDVPSLAERLETYGSDNASLFYLIRIFREFLHLVHFDFLYQRFLNVTVTFIHKTVDLILGNENLSKTDPVIKTLLGCEALLQFSNQTLKKAYTWSSKYPPSSANRCGGPCLELDMESEDNSWYEPSRKTVETPLSGKKGPRENSDISFQHQSQSTCLHELLPTWKLLMKHAKMVATAGFKDRQKSAPECTSDYSEILVELFQRLNTRLFSKSSSTQDIKEKSHSIISKGNRYSLESRHTLAEDAWKEQLAKLKGSSSSVASSSHILHALLYTYLLRGQLAKAMEMVETLVVKNNVSAVTRDGVHSSMEQAPPLFLTVMKSSISSQNEQMVPCIQNPAIRRVLQTLARFMAMYFSNMQVYIFPPNSPTPLPPLHQTAPHNLKERIIPKYQQDITSVVSSSGLEDTWTVGRCLEYLLLSGLVPEAAWFSNKVGDWKAALTISAAYIKHKGIFPLIYKRDCIELSLPEDLLPSEILKRKLSVLLPVNTSSSSSISCKGVFVVSDENHFIQLTAALTSVLTAGILCGVDMACWLFPALVESLKDLVKDFSPNVPDDFHLPAPPYYLWQPTDTSLSDSSGNLSPFAWEKEQRHKISTLVRLILVVLQASRLALPLVRWYVQQLNRNCTKAAETFEDELDGPVTEFPEILKQLGRVKSSLEVFSTDPKISPVLSSFRTLCSLSWLLHARDQLSLHNRLRRAYVERHHIKISRSTDDQWTDLCQTCLLWTIHFIPFCHFLADEAWSYKVLLSLLAEIAPSIHTAQILATHCYDTDQLDPEIQKKLEILLKRWQTVPVLNTRTSTASHRESGFLDEYSSQERSLSVYFQEYCCTVQKNLRKKRKCFGKYDEFVFDRNIPAKHSIHVGSFPFETTESYMKFLDMFFDLSFSKQLEEEGKSQTKPDIPLVEPFVREIEKRQMESMPFRTMTGRHPRQSLLILSSPCKEVVSVGDQSNESERVQSRSRSTDRQTPNKSRGLFRRSQSADISNKSPTSPLNAAEKKQMWSDSKSKHCTTKETTPPGGVRAKSLDSVSAKHGDTMWSFDIDFGLQYCRLNQLVDWMIMWARKNQVLISQLENEPRAGNRGSVSAMHTMVQPQLLVLALWLIEQKYYPVEANSGDPRMSVKFSPCLTEVFEVNSHYQNSSSKPRKGIPGKGKFSSSLSSLSDVEEPQTSPIPGFDRTQFKTWLRSRLINPNEEAEVDTVKKTPNSPLMEEKNFFKKKKTTKKKKTGWDSVNKEDEDDVKLAYQQILQTIDELGSTAEFLDTAGSVPEHSKASSTDPYGLTLTSSNSIGTSQTISKEMTSRGLLSTEIDTRDSRLLDESSSVSLHIRPRNRRTVTEKSGTDTDHRERQDLRHDVREVVQLEIQKLITVQNKQLKSMIGSMLSKDRTRDNKDRRSGNDGSVEDSSGMDSESENQRPWRDMSSRVTQVCQDGMNSTEHVEQQAVEDQRSSRKTSNKVGNMKGVLKELENLQETTHSHSSKEKPISSILKPSVHDRADHITNNPTNARYQNGGSSNNEGTTYRIINEGYSQRPQLINIDHLQNQPFLSFPQVHFASQPLNNEKPILSNPGSNIIMPLLTLNKRNNLFRYTEPHVNMPRFMPQNQETQIQNNATTTTRKSVDSVSNFVNHHNAINSYLQHLGSHPQDFEDPACFYSVTSEPEIPVPMPLLRIPKGKSNLPFRLVPPELIADFRHKLLEKDVEKRHYFENFQQNQLDKLKKNNTEPSTPSQCQLLKLQQMQVSLPKGGKTIYRQPEDNQRPPVNHAKRNQRRMKKEVERSQKEEEKLVETQAKTTTQTSNNPKPVTKETSWLEEVPVEMEENDVPPEKIDDGFVLRPGSFDNYLKLGAQLGVPTENYTKIQYDLATRLQKIRHESKKIDFGTMTKQTCDVSIETDVVNEEPTRTAEAATSITKDIGSDPVPEVMMAYNRAQQGNVLAPDIYLKLRCNDPQWSSEQPNTTDKEENPGRAFLNVIDVSSSVVMAGIPGEPSLISQPRITTNLDQRSQSSKQYHVDTTTLLSELASKSEYPLIRSHQHDNTSDVISAVSGENCSMTLSQQSHQRAGVLRKPLSPVEEDLVSQRISTPELSQTPSQHQQQHHQEHHISDMVVPTVIRGNQHTAMSPQQAPQASQALRPLSPTVEDLAPQMISLPELTPMPGPPTSSDLLMERLFKNDRITYQKFSDYVTPSRSARDVSKDALKTNLMQMDSQIAMLNELALKMEDECQKTKLFCNKVDTMIASEPDMAGSSHIDDMVQRTQHSLVHTQNQMRVPNTREVNFPSAKPATLSHRLAPSTVKQELMLSYLSTNQQREQLDEIIELEGVTEGQVTKDGILIPHMSDQTPVQSSASNLMERDQGSHSRAQNLERIINMSALSGVGDIMVDLVNKGDIDLTDLGLSGEDIEQLTNRGRFSSRSIVQMSVEKLTQMACESEANNNTSSKQQRKLRQWMMNKQSQQQQEFKDKRREMCQQERRPFISKQEAMTFKDIEKAIKSRQDSRTERLAENQERRLIEAEKLILGFQIDQATVKKHSTPPPSPRDAKKYSPTPRKKGVESQPTSTPRHPQPMAEMMVTRTIPQSALLDAIYSRDNDVCSADEDDPNLESAMQNFMNIEHPRSRIPQPNSPSKCTSHPALKIADQRHSPEDTSPKDMTYIQKPYKEIVRLQRPEITRNVVTGDQKPYVERLTDISQKNLQSPRTQDKQKLYGTKKIPTGHTEMGASQRELKTYTERLQEMKNDTRRVFNTGIVPHNLHKPINGASKQAPKHSNQRIPHHKPVPYVDRLRQLSNKGTYTSKGHLASSTVTLRKPPAQYRRPGPPHKPKTYVQQLQATNAAAKVRQASIQHGMKMTKDRTFIRHHPYADPSQAMDDNLSDISEWTLDDRMKHILYESQEVENNGRQARISNSMSDYYDEIISERPLLEPEGMAASLSSCSLSSHIDWAALEKGLTDQMNS